MDIFVLFDRIQMINSKLKIFKKTSVYKVILFIMSFSIFINIPFNAARRIDMHRIKIESNETENEIIMYSYGKFFLIIIFLFIKSE